MATTPASFGPVPGTGKLVTGRIGAPPRHEPFPEPGRGTVVTGRVGTPTPVTPPPPKTSPRVPSQTVKRQATMAAQAAAAATPATPKVFQPWARVIEAAESRMRGRIALALADLEHEFALAGQVLDTAEASAKEASSQIMAAAWARWHRDIAAASDTADAIMDPARRAYTQLIDAAGGAYDKAVAEAKAGYEAELARAQSAQALVSAMPGRTAAAAAS